MWASSGYYIFLTVSIRLLEGYQTPVYLALHACEIGTSDCKLLEGRHCENCAVLFKTDVTHYMHGANALHIASFASAAYGSALGCGSSLNGNAAHQLMLHVLTQSTGIIGL